MTLRKDVIYLSMIILSVATVHTASIADNSVYETPRIYSGDQLISSILDNCLDSAPMVCLKRNVLTYLDTKLNTNVDQGRSLDADNIDKVIYDRVTRILATNELKMELPETFFNRAIVSYRADRGLDIEAPTETSEARGDILKKKLLLPILLLLKLKMKLLMPIFVALIGIKAMKALILSKLAITLVLGFIIYNLVKGKSMAPAMSMAPMTESPMTAFGPPAPSAAPAPSSSYDPSSWEPSSGGPYSRVWDSASSGSNLAYSSYYPSRSSSSSSLTGSTSPLSSSSSSSTGSSSHAAYSSSS